MRYRQTVELVVAPAFRSAPARVDGSPDLIQGLPFLVPAVRKPRLTLADGASHGHTTGVVAREE